jgi:hypothetical protein
VILTADIADNERNGRQVAGAEKYADHAPEKATKASQQKALAHPGIDGEKDLIHEII